ncbi:unnamed protein product [Cyclocybe aegerita]|uniref:Uncharacterized protein n=1 Tax=Cyclocybe aegerita TaxID=1973307 RepID=A0A8S0WTN6_CYCAE|nr:unnamed protein product [Cyclocybe aegerita]
MSSDSAHLARKMDTYREASLGVGVASVRLYSLLAMMSHHHTIRHSAREKAYGDIIVSSLASKEHLCAVNFHSGGLWQIFSRSGQFVGFFPNGFEDDDWRYRKRRLSPVYSFRGDLYLACGAYDDPSASAEAARDCKV